MKNEKNWKKKKQKKKKNDEEGKLLANTHTHKHTSFPTFSQNSILVCYIVWKFCLKGRETKIITKMWRGEWILPLHWTGRDET